VLKKAEATVASFLLRQSANTANRKPFPGDTGDRDQRLEHWTNW